MEELVKVNGTAIPVIEWKGQRVVTTAELASAYGTSTDNIKKNYQLNKEHFDEKNHFYLLKGDELKEFKNKVTDFPLVGKNANQLYLWTRKGASRHCKMLGTDKAWEQFDVLEENYYNPQKAIPTGNDLIALAVIEAQKQLVEKDKQIEAMKPKAIFADAVSTSKTSILVGELAKILKQNGYDTGGQRFFTWLRDNGYLIRRNGTDWNMPTQKSMELGLFEIKESTHIDGNGCNVTTKTPKVTGKGQQYFINKFLGKGDKQ